MQVGHAATGENQLITYRRRGTDRRRVLEIPLTTHRGPWAARTGLRHRCPEQLPVGGCNRLRFCPRPEPGPRLAQAGLHTNTNTGTGRHRHRHATP